MTQIDRRLTDLMNERGWTVGCSACGEGAYHKEMDDDEAWAADHECPPNTAEGPKPYEFDPDAKHNHAPGRASASCRRCRDNEMRRFARQRDRQNTAEGKHGDGSWRQAMGTVELGGERPEDVIRRARGTDRT